MEMKRRLVIEKRLQDIRDAKIRLLLRCRYACEMTWQQVADVMHIKDEHTVIRYHKAFMKTEEGRKFGEGWLNGQ